MEIGDLRVGIDLIKRAVLSAEKEGRTGITREDVDVAYEASRFIYLIQTIGTLDEDEKELLRHIAEASREGGDQTTKIVYSIVQDRMKLSFSKFYTRVKKFDEMHLLYSMGVPGRGRTREIILRYDPEKVIEACS